MRKPDPPEEELRYLQEPGSAINRFWPIERLGMSRLLYTYEQPVLLHTARRQSPISIHKDCQVRHP